MQMKMKRKLVQLYSYQKKKFKPRTVIKDKEGDYIIIKGSIHQDITFINTYAPNIGARKYIKYILTNLKGNNHSNTIIVGNFNTAITSIDRSIRKKINKERSALNDRLVHLKLIDSYRTFHPKATEDTFFSSDVDHSPGQLTFGHEKFQYIQED